MKLKNIASLIILPCMMLSLASCDRTGRYVSVGGYAQGGIYSVKMNIAGLGLDPKVIQADVDSILTLVDTTLSGYNKSSQLSRFNAGEAIVPNALFKDIYAYCHNLYEETGGCLDVASGPLFDLWGFGFSSDSLPSGDKVAQVLASCGMSRLKVCLDEALDAEGWLHPESLIVDPSADATLPRLNFNAVAQGYTCDLVASYLHSLGVKDMLVDIGEIYCEGVNQRGTGWTIGVDRPTDGNNVLGASLDGVWNSDGEACGIVTSGNYRKFYIRDGKKYAHTIDPRTGYPVEHQLLSATITAPNSAAADAYATYCMVLGTDQAKAFIESRTDLEGYLISGSNEDMTEWASDGFNVTLNK